MFLYGTVELLLELQFYAQHRYHFMVYDQICFYVCLITHISVLVHPILSILIYLLFLLNLPFHIWRQKFSIFD